MFIDKNIEDMCTYKTDSYERYFTYKIQNVFYKYI